MAGEVPAQQIGAERPRRLHRSVAAVPLIWFIERIATDRRVMGDARSRWLSRTTLVITFIGMAGSVVALAISYLKG
jgi:hypothetical protein